MIFQQQQLIGRRSALCVMKLLRKICRQVGITAVVSLHQVELARRFADRLVGLSAGRLVVDESPSRIETQQITRIYKRPPSRSRREGIPTSSRLPRSSTSSVARRSAAMGLRAGNNYQEQFVGAHDAVAFAVQNGNAAADGMSKPICETLLQQGAMDPAKARVVAEPKPHPRYPWTMRTDPHPALRSSIVEAFLRLNDPAALGPFKTAAFARWAMRTRTWSAS